MRKRDRKELALSTVEDHPIYIAKVHYYGEVEEDPEIDPEDLRIRAWVEAPEPPELAPGLNAFVPLVSMLGPTHLFMNASAASGALYPAVEMLREASAELLQGESAARSYLAEGKPIRVGGAPMAKSYETATARIPAVVPRSEGQSSRVHEFALMERGSAQIWARSRAPEEGGQAFFANSGLMLLIQHIAHGCNYRETVIPMAAGVGAFLAQFEAYETELSEDRGEKMTEEGWGTIGVGILQMDWGVIGAVAYADDPREALDRLKGGEAG